MLPHRLGREAAVIRLQDRWGNFVRDLILISYVGNCDNGKRESNTYGNTRDEEGDGSRSPSSYLYWQN
jgi:hypothetical protein